MTEQSTLLSRIGRWFKKEGATAANGDIVGDPQSSTAMEHRTTFLRPWAKRDAAIQHLQESFTTLTDLMGAIRDNLQKQNERQDELMGALSQLPQVLQQLPENQRVQSETLQAIRVQITGQSAQQERLGDILSKIGTGATEQRQMVDTLRERVEEIHKQDVSIADYLNNVGTAMKDVSKNSATASQVLEQMRDNIDNRDGQLERVMQRQSTRFTTMLAVAIFLSVSALVAVCVIGFLLLNKPH